jgi:hypothetical protein
MTNPTLWRAICRPFWQGLRERIPGFHPGQPGAAAQDTRTMDIEHINSIGTLLADLSARTEQLRGYL